MRRGFSLVECLVVVAIVGILAAFLFPVLGSAKDRARSASDISALSQIGHAYALYESEYGAYPRRLSTVAETGDLPNALLFSRLDPYPEGEASALTGDHTRAISFIDSCDYPILTRGGTKAWPTCLATPEELLGLPAGGPLVFLGADHSAPLLMPGFRAGAARYLRLTFAGGVVARVSRQYPPMPGQVVPSNAGWGDWPQARFYDENGSPYETFYDLRHQGN